MGMNADLSLSEETLDRILETCIAASAEDGRYLQQLDADEIRTLVDRYRRLRNLLREVIDDASPCTTACHVTVAERLIDAAKGLVEGRAET
jgi:hypothetical protein